MKIKIGKRGIIMFKKKRSQAALEFLTTYAWAFLVILIMVSALAYFGILNPFKLLPDRCNFGSEIGCDKNKMIFKDSDIGTLQMVLINNFGTTVKVQSTTEAIADVDVGTCTVKIADIGVAAAEIPEEGFTWDAGASLQFNVDCDAGEDLVAEEKMKMRVEIDYYPAGAGSTYAKVVYGDMFGAIQP
ncbi:MAG TPA: hypothetical protein QF458_02715 [Candidatus Woesearchaeota archaeon]|nr:hypothetical protein [Candidatus Woesearchaeota archaeon]